MRVVEIKDIEKAPGWIYYLQRYSANATIEIPGQQVSIPFSFSIETGPLGNKNIELDDIPNTLNYPVFPIMRALKESVLILSKQGNLP